MPEAKRAPQASKKLLVARNLVLEMIVSGASLDRVFRALVAFIEQQVPAARCVIFLADPDGHSLNLAASSKLPRSFARLMDRRPIGPHAAPSGQAAYRRERVIVPDVTAHPLYPRQLFQEYDLRSCWATPIVSEAGAVLGVVSIYRTQIHVPGKAEIAAVEEAARLAGAALERLRGETGSKAGYEDFRALIENTSDVISVLDLNGVIRYLSPSVLRILGFHPGELIGTSGFDCFHPDDLAHARWAFEQVLRQPGVCRPIEQRFRHKNGSWRTLETVANNQLETPTIRGVIVTGHDITDRKRTEQELISSQERYRELFENANEIVYTHDLSGRLSALNKAGEQITGYSRAEAIGMNISEFIAPEYRLLLARNAGPQDRRRGKDHRQVGDLKQERCANLARSKHAPDLSAGQAGRRSRHRAGRHRAAAAGVPTFAVA
jgi:PAS domain S-box